MTGGGSGIGRATVDRFVAEGGRVVAGDLDEPALASLAEELGDAVATVAGDASAEADVERLVDTAVERFGRLDIAFANAGIGSAQRLVDADLEHWSRVLDVNLTGPFLMIKHAARRMDDGGSIIVTASLNAVQAGPGHGRVLRVEGRRRHARAGRRAGARPVGHPGERHRPRLRAHRADRGGVLIPAIVDGYVENTPMGRHADPEEIAGLVTYLASDEASFVSGSLQLIDGGAHTMRYPDILGALGA